MASPILAPSEERRLGAERRREFDSRPLLSQAAIVLWCAFLGAALELMAALTLLPHEALGGLHEMSVLFLSAWAVTAVPVAFALLLAPRRGH